jgi:hypothetical protein
MKSLLLTLVALGVAALFSSTSAGTPVQTVTWSQQFSNSWTWSGARTHAGALVEAGYNDWRLPTRAELRTAIQSGALPVLIPVSPNGATIPFWTSEKRGNRAYAILIATDANGVVLAAQSGAEALLTLPSFVHAIATRP